MPLSLHVQPIQQGFALTAMIAAEEEVEWQNRPLDAIYPIIYLDCIVLKVRQDSRVINKSVFLAPGINIEGQKELPGMWLAENEGAEFWLNVLTELKNRGLNDILITCVDGLKGFPDAINAVYPQTQTELCIVHRVRNSLRFVFWKDYKAVPATRKPSPPQKKQAGRRWKCSAVLGTAAILR